MAYQRIPVTFITLDRDLNPPDPPGISAGFAGISIIGVVALWMFFVVIAVTAWMQQPRHRPHHSPTLCWSSLDPGYCK